MYQIPLIPQKLMHKYETRRQVSFKEATSYFQAAYLLSWTGQVVQWQEGKPQRIFPALVRHIPPGHSHKLPNNGCATH